MVSASVKSVYASPCPDPVLNVVGELGSYRIVNVQAVPTGMPGVPADTLAAMTCVQSFGSVVETIVADPLVLL